MIRRRQLVIAFGAGALAAPLGSFAQQQGKVWRLGLLETTSMSLNAANLNSFPSGMQDLGMGEGRDFLIDYRSADGRGERFPELAAELMRAKVDLILARGTLATQAAKKSSEAIPIVATALGEPLLLVASLSRPSGNITGLSSVTTDLSTKRLELLKEVFPKVSSIAVLMNMGNAALPPQWNETEKAARSLGVRCHLHDVRRTEDLERALEVATKQRSNALLVGQDGLIQTNGKHLVALAAKHRMPAIYPSNEYVADGGLIGYGVSYPDLYRRAASYVVKIMNGAKPGDLPVEQPTKFELFVNMKTAKALGIKIPNSILVRADKVIE